MGYHKNPRAKGTYKKKQFEVGKISSVRIKDINSFRETMGLSPIKTTLRKCLRCDEEFKSENSGNRLCGSCEKGYDPLQDRILPDY